VLAHLVSSLGTHTVQKSRWLRSGMSRTYYMSRCRRPPLPGASAPERTWATPQPDRRLCDRSHAHSSRPRTASNFPSHQSVTGRRPTGLTVTFSRPFDGPLERRPSPRGDGKSRLSLNRRELVQSFVSLAQKRGPELRYLTHIANVHV